MNAGRPESVFADDTRAPAIVAELVAVIGEEAYTRLEARLGGSQIYIPRHPGPDHLLTHVVGPEAAELIGEYFHGLNLLVPLGAWRRAETQKAQILALGERGLSGDEIARRLRISRSWAYEVLGLAKTRQGGLFD